MQLHPIVFFNFVNIAHVHIKLYLVPMADYVIRHIFILLEVYMAINDFSYLYVDLSTWFMVAAPSYRAISNSPILYLTMISAGFL